MTRCIDCLREGKITEVETTKFRNPNYPHDCGCDLCDHVEPEFYSKRFCPRNGTHKLFEVFGTERHDPSVNSLTLLKGKGSDDPGDP